MLKDLGVGLVELGHSERREHFGDTDLTVQRKVQAVLRHGMHALICVGETAQEKELGVGTERLRAQVKIALHGVPEGALDQIWIAYEPVWAIGEKGVPAEAPYANEMHGVIRQVLKELYPNRGGCTHSLRRQRQLGQCRIFRSPAGSGRPFCGQVGLGSGAV